jgi:hypothetical protein
MDMIYASSGCILDSPFFGVIGVIFMDPPLSLV